MASTLSRITLFFDILTRFLRRFLPGFCQYFCQDLVSSLEPVPDNHCLPWLCNHVLPLFCLCWARSLLGWKNKNKRLVKTYVMDCARWFYWLNYWHILDKQGKSSFKSNTSLIRNSILLSV